MHNDMLRFLHACRLMPSKQRQNGMNRNLPFTTLLVMASIPTAISTHCLLLRLRIIDWATGNQESVVIQF